MWHKCHTHAHTRLHNLGRRSRGEWVCPDGPEEGGYLDFPVPTGGLCLAHTPIGDGGYLAGFYSIVLVRRRDHQDQPN